MITREQIAAAARGWLDTPFVHQASLRGIGTDCAGLVVGVARECGIAEAAAFDSDLRFRGYARTPGPRTLIAACDAYLDKIEIPSARLADILLLRWPQSPDPMHFAIIVDESGPYVVHALATIGKVVEHRMDDHWRSRVTRAYSYRGVA